MTTGNQTVAEMTAASALTGTELFYTVQGGNDRKSTPTQLRTLLLGTATSTLSIAAGKTLTLTQDLTLPSTNGSSGQFLQTNGSGVSSWQTVSTGIAIGTTPITSGTTTRFLYDLAGVVSETAGLTYTAATPSVNFSAHALFSADNTYDIGASGATRPRSVYVASTIAAAGSITGQNLTVDATGYLYFNGRGSLQAAADGEFVLYNNASTSYSHLAVDAANTLALRNSTNPQTFNVYNTYTDGSNYECGRIIWSSNVFRVLSAAGVGTGTSRPMQIGTSGSAYLSFATSGADRWVVDASGNFTANADNTFDIGASGASRPKNVYIANDVLAGGGGTFVGNVQIGAGAYFYWAGRSQMSSPADGNILMWDTAQTSFSRLQFGGTTSSFPALKRSSAALTCRLADDSADAAFNAFSVATSGNISTSGGNLIAPNGGNVIFGARSLINCAADGSLSFSDQNSTKIVTVTAAVTGTLQLGAADVDTNASMVAQTLRTQGALTGGTSDQAGKNFTIIVSPGKGTGAGGSFIVQTAPAGGSGTTPGTPTTALTIDSTGLCTFAFTSIRVNATPSAIGTGIKTISNAADGTTNFGHYAVINMNGTPYYFPCSAVAPT